MNIETVRRKNLGKYIKENYKNLRRFSVKYSINYGNLHSMLKGERAFGERFARDLETQIGLAYNFFDRDENYHDTKINEMEIPIYGNKLSAGGGNKVFDEEVVGYHLLNSHDLKAEGLLKENLCIFYVKGDSMLPEIQDGAKVLVDVSQNKLIDNKIYAFSINGEVYIKELFKESKSPQVIIRSANKEYPDKKLDSADEFKIIGRVVYLLGRRL
jgi:phage repressor protein C with HTH and peptisase S24 domain